MATSSLGERRPKSNRHPGSMAAEKMDKTAKASRLPIHVSLLGADLQICLAGKVTVDLSSEPFEPFKGFLGTGAPAFLFNVGSQLPPGEPDYPSPQIAAHLQGNDSRINRIAEPFQDDADRGSSIQDARVTFNRRGSGIIRNIVDDQHRLHPFARQNRLHRGESRTLFAIAPGP